MQSRLFTTVFDDPESGGAKTITRHLNKLLSLDKGTLSDCMAALPELLKPRTEFQTRRLVEGIANSRRIDLASVENSLSVLKFLVGALLSDSVPKDDHRNWATDLVELKVIDKANQSTFQSIVDGLVRRRAALQAQEREERAITGVIPRLKSIGTTVEARAMANERYRWGTPLDKYQPEVLGVAYVVSVSIGVDEGFPESFYFQLDEAGLDSLIASLGAAKKEIGALRQYLGRSFEEGRVQ
jgi:hypothetical protein